MDYKPALILIIISAFIHPFWNVFLKKSDDKIIFYFNIHLFFIILFSFIPFIYPVGLISQKGWMLVILSSLAHFFYQVFLCKTYELGDMSLTYPVIRSSPLIVVIMGFLFLREQISFISLAAIIIIVLGTQIINQREISLREFFNSWRFADKKILIAAIMTAVFSAFYALIDKKGALELSPILFFYLFFSFSGLLFGIYLLFFKQKRKGYWLMTKRDKYKITIASLLEFFSYILILYAFQKTKVATVIAIRQISIVFGVLFGILFLKEQYGKIRIIASLIIFMGIYLLVIFK